MMQQCQSTKEELKANVEHGMNSLTLWFACNKLALNVLERYGVNSLPSQSFTFDNPIKFHTLNLLLSSCVCSCLRPDKCDKYYLGLSLDEKHSCKYHIKSVKRYLFISLRVVFYLRPLSPDETPRKIYYCLVQSKILTKTMVFMLGKYVF